MSGWTCSVCGVFVQLGQYHVCGGAGGMGPYRESDSVALALGRIEALLQEILRKLDKPA